MNISHKIAIKENSWLAKVAAWKLGTGRVALVMGSTIHLWGCSRKAFLNNEKWVKHELAHVEQFRRHGLVWFCVLYLAESLRNGYTNNRFEQEAREAENA